jgi:hypothetical protein
MMTRSDLEIAAQLDETTPSDEVIDLINQVHARLNIHVGLICGESDDNARQDTALTELESRVEEQRLMLSEHAAFCVEARKEYERRITDLEKQNADLWQALSGFAHLSERVEEIARCIARSNLRCQ